MMNKWFRTALIIMLLSMSLAVAAYAKHDQHPSAKALHIKDKDEINSYDIKLDHLIQQGIFKLNKVQQDTVLTEYTHERYSQFYKSIAVWGGEIIKHRKNKSVYLINGNYYNNINVSVTSVIDDRKAIAKAKSDSNKNSFKTTQCELVIYPDAQKYYLAYRITLFDFGYRWIYFVSAVDGKIINKYNDIKTEGTIGRGTGTHGDAKKFSSEKDGTYYYSHDVMRPASIITYDMNHDDSTGNLMKNTDNIWTDGAFVDAHVYAGWVYDFFYKNFNRNSIDNNNMEVKSFVHYLWNYNNAFWDGYEMVYGDGDGVECSYFSGALDVVAHEISHGVTDYTSRLIYSYESGALSEAFSDIMGTSAEFYFESPGSGPLRADWRMGEDACYPGLRFMDNPHINGLPAHYSERYTGTQDNGGVHINCTIVDNTFYLLANGGTNDVSGISVSGIGINPAMQIFYRGFTVYLTPSSNFSDARIATVQAAIDLYGVSSTELQRLNQAWNAVGVN